MKQLSVLHRNHLKSFWQTQRLQRLLLNFKLKYKAVYRNRKNNIGRRKQQNRMVMAFMLDLIVSLSSLKLCTDTPLHRVIGLAISTSGANIQTTTYLSFITDFKLERKISCGHPDSISAAKALRREKVPLDLSSTLSSEEHAHST